MSLNQKLSKLRADGYITDDEYKMLKQEPCEDATLQDIFCMGCEYKEQEPCEDAISREAAICCFFDDSGYWYDALKVRDNIRALPSVTPTRPTGHWIEKNDDYNDWYECSECEYGSEGEMQYSSECDVRTNYCPCCGAKMVESQESEGL